MSSIVDGIVIFLGMGLRSKEKTTASQQKDEMKRGTSLQRKNEKIANGGARSVLVGYFVPCSQATGHLDVATSKSSTRLVFLHVVTIPEMKISTSSVTLIICYSLATLKWSAFLKATSYVSWSLYPTLASATKENRLDEIIDSQVMNADTHREIQEVAKVAVWCTRSTGE